MKLSALALASFLLTACSGSLANQESDTQSANIPDLGKGKGFKFVKDNRPADGELVEVILVRDFKAAKPSFDATLHLRNARKPDTWRTELLATGLICRLGKLDKKLGLVSSVNCQDDRRPVDGPLVKIDIVLDQDGTYTATKETLIVPRFPAGGPQVEPRIDLLGKGLTFKNKLD